MSQEGGQVEYDAIVVGAGISGLGLSALLSNAGKRVLTLEWAAHIGGRAHSFERKGHIMNIGGPRAGLANGRVDALFAELGLEPGERGFFEGVKTYRDGEFISLPTLMLRGDREEAGKLMATTRELAESGDLAKYDAMTAQEWIEPLVKSVEVLDSARYASIVMNTIPRLEDVAASALFESMRIIQTNPRIYLAAHGYGDFMRWNLKTDRSEKVIDKAWLKSVAAFLNSDGGVLLVGVTDNSDIMGIETDNFDNEDKYLLHVNNRIQQHIGLEHAGFIGYQLVPVDNQKVLLVECQPSPSPVFLKISKEEEFYIRVGPGSRRLSTSEVVAYVTNRRTDS